MPYDVHGLAQHLGGLLGGHASEVAHLDELHEAWIFLRERFESRVQIQDFQLR